MTENEKRFMLLQITDSVFPIGAYAHSFGLETYVQEGLITNGREAADFIRNYITHSLTVTELAAVSFCYKYLEAGDLTAVAALEQRMNAARTALELRQAANKLAARFIKTVSDYVLPEEKERWQQYAAGGRNEMDGAFYQVSGRTIIPHQYAVAYGMFCALAGIAKEDSLTAFAYSQISAMTVNCVKLIPLSQTTGQQILFSLYGTMTEAVKAAQVLPEGRFLQAAPGLELRAMQHEALYSRIYMS